MASPSLVRGCGTRAPGGTYLVCAPGPDGIALEDLVIDPPVPVDPQALGLGAVGVLLHAERGTFTTVLDWVGADSYPNTADFVEEMALFGSSRRVPTTTDFAKLGPGSQHVLVHGRASVTNPEWPLAHRPPRPWRERPSFLHRSLTRTDRDWCPFNSAHEAEDEYLENWCAHLWWETLQPETLAESDLDARHWREQAALREMPMLRYAGYPLPPPDEWTPAWQPALFLRLPITRIEIVRDPEGATHEGALERARRAYLPVIEVDE